MTKPKVAFICVHNSCRSQIAEALGKLLAGDVFESYSAGTETKPRINQDAVRLMKELYGIDMEQTQYSKLVSDIPKPDNLAEMLACAAELSKSFSHVRVDFYNVKNRLVFGEMTFYHGAGYLHFEHEEFERKLGSYWEIGK